MPYRTTSAIYHTTSAVSATRKAQKQNGREQNDAHCSLLLHGAPVPGAQTSPRRSPGSSLQLFDSQSSCLVQVAMSGNFSKAQNPTVVSSVPFVQEKMQLLLRSWQSAGAVQFPPSSTGPPPCDNSSLPELSTIGGCGGGGVPPAGAIVRGCERATTGWRIGAAVGTEGAAAAALLAAPLLLLPPVAGEGHQLAVRQVQALAQCQVPTVLAPRAQQAAHRVGMGLGHRLAA